MSKVNAFQVQKTNNVSIISKCSAASKNYFQDPFIEEFTGKPKVRAPLIHLGYYTRAETLNRLINNYIKFLKIQKELKFQIVSCGCGFDTTFWRLSQSKLLDDKSVLIEIDFPSVVQEKMLLIKQSEKLKSYFSKTICSESHNKLHKLSDNYYMLEADLCNLLLIEELLSEININFEIPTLFLSECAITYMKVEDSDNLIKWMAKKFRNCCFINYEQIHPFDAFGQIMVNHFQKLQSPLFSIFKYPDCKSHLLRYKNLGFQNSFAISEWDGLMWLTSEEERKKAFSLEVFDELEEFHLKCAHYVIAIAANGISSTWIESFPSYQLKISYEAESRPKVHCESLKNSLKLFKHCSCNVKDYCILFGGYNWQNRSSQIYKCPFGSLDLKLIQKPDSFDVKLDLVYGSVTYFEINEVPFVCLYGGRTSPDKIWNNGLPAVFELIEGEEFLLRPIVNEGNPIPRYRSAMVSLGSKKNEAQFWMFGGRTTYLKELCNTKLYNKLITSFIFCVQSQHSLSDFWQLTISHWDKNCLKCKWVQPKRTSHLWPSDRMSHSFAACPERSALFLSGGIQTDSLNVLNDLWKWCCKTESWEKIELIGNLLPRYGHTSHVKDNMIYLVGGVNSLSGMQPVLATVSLNNQTVTEYSLPLPSPSSLLFNHTSVIINHGNVKGDNAIKIIGGGGQCFSFGTYFNEDTITLTIVPVRLTSRNT